MGADLYLHKVDVQKYQGVINNSNAELFSIINDAENVLPEIPVPETPVPADTGSITFGEPDQDSPVLITGNSLYTHMVMGTILDTVGINCYLLSVDTEGYTVDMAVLLGKFSCDEVRRILDASGIEGSVEHRVMVIPGFAAELKDDLERETGWNVLVGPICGVELPIYLVTNWFK